MKRILTVVFTGLVLSSFAVFGQQNNAAPAADSQEQIRIFDELSIPKEYSKEDVQPTIVNGFDFADEWSVLMPSDQGIATKKRVTAKAKIDDSDSKYCLGIKCVSFTRGFNWVEIKPPAPVRMPAKAKAISAIVMGRNFRHKLVAWVQDYWGQEYRIEMGSLEFKGWRRVSALIPDYVRSYSRYVPEYRSLYLKKFVIEFDPNEYPGEEYAFYFYLDRFEVARDVFNDTSYEDLLLDEAGQEQFDREQWDPMKRDQPATGGQ
jgi:hypothetical protein